MKKIALLLVLMTTFLSCSVGDGDTYTNYVLPVDSYTLPENLLTVNTSYEVKLKYQKPTACYTYEGIYYYSEENTRTIGIYASVKNGESCSDTTPPLSEVSFNFTPTAAGTYIFKFYKGNDVDDADDDGITDEDLFEDVEVVVNAAQ